MSYSTVGLHGVRNEMDGNDVRVEVAGVASAMKREFANLISTAAFYVMKDRWLAAPGVVFPYLLDEYELSTSLRHLIWFEPFPWPQLSSLELDEQTVHWLVGVAISDSERELVEDGGFWELERRFVGEEVAFYDLDRDPVV